MQVEAKFQLAESRGVDVLLTSGEAACSLGNVLIERKTIVGDRLLRTGSPEDLVTLHVLLQGVSQWETRTSSRRSWSGKAKCTLGGCDTTNILFTNRIAAIAKPLSLHVQGVHADNH